MKKLYTGFLADNELLFVGYSSRNNQYSKSIYQAFSNNGIKVYPYNTKENASYDIKVYKTLEELPKMPKAAFILLSRENTAKAVKQLADKGINKILFHSAKTADPAVIEECEKRGIETAIGCPLMLYGKGLHRFHGFLAGVK
ncbi:CoA-binding protein [Mobilitalea sibirica]|uniref:CoA-binding protein n=1 Tax=Mobilitalea sibirica TaxID=1462919 RepID=A0A8J7KZS1_9FIRM|nr:CoA-binding protein [Mobilitalea sibirica]MBH1940833.1 CoA-binding protein [Mobilitalea sibirica]